MGDGNLHYNVSQPPEADPASFLGLYRPINRIVYDAVVARGGSISAEHGIGALKRDDLERHKPPVALEMMRAIKRALDPADIMNPGKLVPR